MVRKIGASMMRNSRLLEVLMDSALKVEIDEEMVCGIEHHMNKQFTDALCTMLGHPRKCPHEHEIPIGRMLQIKLNEPQSQKIYQIKNFINMACFCGCETYQKNENGFCMCKMLFLKIMMILRAARKNESLQKRDADFGLFSNYFN